MIRSSQLPHKDNLRCIGRILKEIFKESNYSLLRKQHKLITSIIGHMFLYACHVDHHIESNDVLNEAWIVGIKTLAEILGCTSPDFINVTEQFAFAVIELIEKRCVIGSNILSDVNKVQGDPKVVHP